MARTYKTLSLSLPPAVARKLVATGRATGRTGARVAAEIVLREVAARSEVREETRRRSWCCGARLILVRGPLVIIDKKHDASRAWIPVVVLLCGVCRRQMHGHEYEKWITETPVNSALGRALVKDRRANLKPKKSRKP